jgi:hypothetical protein
VSPIVLQRQAALVGAALLASLLVVALDRQADEVVVPVPPPVSQVRWDSAVVGVAQTTTATACTTATAGEAGVIHPVLPCRAKLVVSANGTELRTEVVGQGEIPAGKAFALTPALAAQLGVRGGDRIRWRFAG